MKSKTPSFIIERKIIIKDIQDNYYLEHKFNVGNRIYNSLVYHYRIVIDELYQDAWYQYAYDKMKNATDEEDKLFWLNEISLCAENYGLTEYSIHGYLTELSNTLYHKALNADIAQKLGSEFYASIKKAIYQKTKIHYRKFGKTNSLSAKKKNTGIIYKEKTDSVNIMGREYYLKKIRKKDYWLQEAMTHKIKYCRIVRRCYGRKYCYFLQIIMAGTSPKKFEKGKGNCGIDEGTSTIACSSEKETLFSVLADGVEKYNKEIRFYANQYERRQRLANPQCFNENGTIKKGSRFSNHTKGTKEALFRLKSAYQKKKAFIRNCHGKLINHIIGLCDHIIKEPMNFAALAKKAKGPAKRQDKSSLIKTKNGKAKNIRKYKRKKRYGSSVQRRAPGLFNSLLEQKANQYDIDITDIVLKKYRASQYDHHTGLYHKPGLTERAKKIAGHKVQRDLYSAFLLENILTEEQPDQNKCKINFKRFLKNQGRTVSQIIKTGDITKNFGLKYFISSDI